MVGRTRVQVLFAFVAEDIVLAGCRTGCEYVVGIDAIGSEASGPLESSGDRNERRQRHNKNYTFANVFWRDFVVIISRSRLSFEVISKYYLRMVIACVSISKWCVRYESWRLYVDIYSRFHYEFLDIYISYRLKHVSVD